MNEQAIQHRPALAGALRAVARIALGAGLAFAGCTHLTSQRREFQAQVPEWLPVDKDLVVLGSGVAEIALGTALVLLPKQKQIVGNLVVAFFTAIFPGNISQLVTRTDAFGLNSDAKRLARLPLQPLLIAWAFWATRSRSAAS